MQLHIARIDITKIKWRSLVAVFSALALAVSLAVTASVGAASTTLVVDPDGKATKNNCNSNTPTPYLTINAAVLVAVDGDTVKVCPGAYPESVLINEKLTLKGARAGDSVGSRTFGSPSESTVTGLVTIQAPDVTVDGFSLTNPGQGLGVLVKTVGNNAVVKKNIIKTVGSNTFVGPTVGVYLELGPDNVTVKGNKISDVQSQTGSAQGLLVGDSSSTNPSLDTTIAGNTISEIASVTRGAYGVQVNNGVSSTGYAEVEIAGNTIKNLNGGGWTRGIGLEGKTPNAVVEGNTISNLTAPVPAAAAGVFTEDNVFFFTASVNQNSLNVGPGSYGIFVHPALTTLYPSLSLDGECNWWGNSNGPGLVAAGSGSLVTVGVDFKPWLKSSNIRKDCDNNGHHHGDWNDKHHGHDWGHHDWDDD